MFYTRLQLKLLHMQLLITWRTILLMVIGHQVISPLGAWVLNSLNNFFKADNNISYELPVHLSLLQLLQFNSNEFRSSFFFSCSAKN